MGLPVPSMGRHKAPAAQRLPCKNRLTHSFFVIPGRRFFSLKSFFFFYYHHPTPWFGRKKILMPTRPLVRTEKAMLERWMTLSTRLILCLPHPTTAGASSAPWLLRRRALDPACTDDHPSLPPERNLFARPNGSVWEALRANDDPGKSRAFGM
jgi:hypothetical protein